MKDRKGRGNLLGVSFCVDCREWNTPVHHVEMRLVCLIYIAGYSIRNGCVEADHFVGVDACSRDYKSRDRIGNGKSEAQGQECHCQWY